jgi:hypothetical protein
MLTTYSIAANQVSHYYVIYSAIGMKSIETRDNVENLRRKSLKEILVQTVKNHKYEHINHLL